MRILPYGYRVAVVREWVELGCYENWNPGISSFGEAEPYFTGGVRF